MKKECKQDLFFFFTQTFYAMQKILSVYLLYSDRLRVLMETLITNIFIYSQEKKKKKTKSRRNRVRVGLSACLCKEGSCCSGLFFYD